MTPFKYFYLFSGDNSTTRGISEFLIVRPDINDGSEAQQVSGPRNRNPILCLVKVTPLFYPKKEPHVETTNILSWKQYFYLLVH